MLATAIIVFRETLEAALFIGIIAAATRGLMGRTGWLSAGVAAGAMGALLLAAGADKISALAEGIGQDLLNVWILSLALLMLAWHCIWVSTQGRDKAQEAKTLGLTAARSGGRALWALALAVALAVLREGAETVLFVAGLVSGSADGMQAAQAVIGGVLLGLTAGIAMGLLLYFGLSRIKPQQLFTITNVLVLVLAASMASQLAKTLAQSGFVTLWQESLWDSSAIISATSPLGTLLHALIGYDVRPSGLQLFFYASAIIIIGFAARWVRLSRSRQNIAAIPAAPGAALAVNA